MNPQVDDFIVKVPKWREEMKALRRIVLDCGLDEEIKWNIPVYTHKGKNIVAVSGFKEYCALAFFKGALLQDSEGILKQPGKVQSGRMVKFTGEKEIAKLEPILKAYIFEAIEVEKAGLKIIKKKTSDYPVPEEFRKKLNKLPALKKAFNALTPGRQRGYLVYFAQAKQSKTRKTRIEKYISKILSGKGLLD
jgi:uncharacterized protein YdeI (YjbR/CyaY-like superfamily)